MPRNYQSTEVFLRPDPHFHSKLATKMINKIMLSGKKTTAQSIFYDALELAKKKIAGVEGLEIMTQAVDKVKPQLEVRSRRVGGATYQVPREVPRHRQQSLAIRWIVENARKKSGKPMSVRLSEEFVDAYNGVGASITQRDNVHKMAEANKAFSHFAW